MQDPTTFRSPVHLLRTKQFKHRILPLMGSGMNPYRSLLLLKQCSSSFHSQMTIKLSIYLSIMRLVRVLCEALSRSQWDLPVLKVLNVRVQDAHCPDFNKPIRVIKMNDVHVITSPGPRQNSQTVFFLKFSFVIFFCQYTVSHN